MPPSSDDSAPAERLRAAETAWPLAGTRAFDAVPPGWRSAIASQLETHLRRHVMDCWFPRTVDLERGGFHSDFDRRWRPARPDERMLEFQVRQMRTAARLGIAYPRQARWPEIALHGLRYLNEVMRDRQDGGWFWLVARDGSPLANGTKHAHSTAYVISACVEVFRLTGQPEALNTARRAFDWLDRTLHDEQNGGYHGWATREGRPIMTAADAGDWPRSTDPLGHEIGMKDVNVHSDLLESLRLLYAESAEPLVRDRLREVYDICATRFIAPDGTLSYLLRPDLSPVLGPEHFGYAFQCAVRMPLVAPLIGIPVATAFEKSRVAVAHALAAATHPRGGFVEMSVGERAGRRTWWVQTEAIQALLLRHVTEPSDTYRRMVEELMRLVVDELLDHRYAGWHQVPGSDLGWLDRVLARRRPKGHRWKDASHETDMSLSATRMLRGLRAQQPLAA